MTNRVTQLNAQTIRRLRVRIQRKVSRIHKDNRRTLIALQFFSSVLEYFDFFAFAYLSMYFIKFFPHDLLEIYGMALLSLVSFLFRPVGYRLYLYLIQRISPLKLYTINSILISLAILSTGLMPFGDGDMGLMIVLIFIGRAVYGICFGIRLQGNLQFVKRHYPARIHNALLSTLIGAQVGLSCASFVNKMIYNHLSSSDMDWGWRIPFFIGALFSFVLFVVRMIIHKPEQQKIPVRAMLPQSIDQVAFQAGRQLWLSLLLSSARACLMFNLFISVPLMLNWVLKWSYGSITNIMFVAALLNSGASWYIRLRKVKSQGNHILITLILSLLFSAIIGWAIVYHDYLWIVSCIFILAIINGYLFFNIPKFINNLFEVRYRQEAMLFIGNFEFFHFNLLRRCLLVVSLIYFGSVITQHCFLAIMIVTMEITFLAGILALISIRRGNFPKKECGNMTSMA